MNYTYMLRCGDGSLYTGWTNAPISIVIALELLNEKFFN